MPNYVTRNLAPKTSLALDTFVRGAAVYSESKDGSDDEPCGKRYILINDVCKDNGKCGFIITNTPAGAKALADAAGISDEKTGADTQTKRNQVLSITEDQYSSWIVNDDYFISDTSKDERRVDKFEELTHIRKKPISAAQMQAFNTAVERRILAAESAGSVVVSVPTESAAGSNGAEQDLIRGTQVGRYIRCPDAKCPPSPVTVVSALNYTGNAAGVITGALQTVGHLPVATTAARYVAPTIVGAVSGGYSLWKACRKAKDVSEGIGKAATIVLVGGIAGVAAGLGT